MKTLRILLLSGLVAAPLAGSPVLAGNTLNPQTAENLKTAMHGEAFANLKYLAYAEFARRNGNPELAALFSENANVEANEHFDREAAALGLVEGNEADLLDAMAGEHYENTVMYVKFAEQADAAGDTKVAEMFRQIAADEGDHYASYKAALENLKAGK